MLKQLFLLTIILLITLGTFAQQKNDTVFFYQVDEYLLSNKNKILLDDYMFQFKPEQTDTIYVWSFCDSTASFSYNYKLAHKRAVEVMKYIKQLPNCRRITVITKGFGELSYHDKECNIDYNLNRKTKLSVSKTKSNATLKKNETKKKTISDWVDSSKVGDMLALRNINFLPGQTIVLPESKEQLSELLEVMQDNLTLKIEIQGHICCSPYDETNLSKRRAQTIYNYLVENKISPDRMNYIGFGNTKALYPYPESTNEQRIANRRVEIKIIKK